MSPVAHSLHDSALESARLARLACWFGLRLARGWRSVLVTRICVRVRKHFGDVGCEGLLHPLPRRVEGFSEIVGQCVTEDVVGQKKPMHSFCRADAALLMWSRSARVDGGEFGKGELKNVGGGWLASSCGWRSSGCRFACQGGGGLECLRFVSGQECH